MLESMSGHAIVVAAAAGRVRVVLGGQTIAESTRAVVLREGRLPPVHYVPRDDVDAAAIRRTNHHSHFPFNAPQASRKTKESARKAVRRVRITPVQR